MDNHEAAQRITQVVVQHIIEKVRGTGGRSTAGLTDAVEKELDAIEQEERMPTFRPRPQPSSAWHQQEPGIDY